MRTNLFHHLKCIIYKQKCKNKITLIYLSDIMVFKTNKPYKIIQSDQWIIFQSGGFFNKTKKLTWKL